MFMSRLVTLKYVLKYLLFVYKMGIILFTVYTQDISFFYVQGSVYSSCTLIRLSRLYGITEDQALI